MTGTVALTEVIAGPMRKVVFDWTSDAAGSVIATTVHAYQGRVVATHILPGVGAAMPDDLFDVAIVDSHGIDILYGAGANLPQANTTILGSAGPVANDRLTLRVTEAGNKPATGDVE